MNIPTGRVNPANALTSVCELLRLVSVRIRSAKPQHDSPPVLLGAIITGRLAAITTERTNSRRAGTMDGGHNGPEFWNAAKMADRGMLSAIGLDN